MYVLFLRARGTYPQQPRVGAEETSLSCVSVLAALSACFLPTFIFKRILGGFMGVPVKLSFTAKCLNAMDPFSGVADMAAGSMRCLPHIFFV